MDQAKAVINIKEGVVQLEGPVEFVERYLERYAPTVKGVSTPQSHVTPSTESEVEGQSGEGGTALMHRAIRAEIKARFFDEPKSTRLVRERLTEKGVECSIGMLRNNLKKVV